jgi:hypothetical protein
LKSVKTLNDKVESAKGLGVDLDSGLIADVNRTTSRLISERDLRHEMKMTVVIESDHEKVDKMKSLIDKASEYNVEDCYMKSADKLSTQMNGNIKAREILQMLLDYPEREYPEVEIVDPKKKKAAKKEEEKKKKKKKKKEAPFPIPDWALELDAVVS